MGNRIHSLQASVSGDAAKVTTYADDYITAGKGFQVKRRIALTSAQVLYLEFDISKAVKKFVYSLPLRMTTGGGMVFVDTYSADSSTGGTVLQTPINLNALSPIVAQTTVKTGVSVTGTPVNVREYIVGTASTNQSSGGGASSPGVPKVLDNRKPLYFKIENKEDATTYFDLEFVWYEI